MTRAMQVAQDLLVVQVLTDILDHKVTLVLWVARAIQVRLVQVLLLLAV